MPTAARYFEHVSKAKALEAVTAGAPDQVTRLSKLKKGDLAKEAERLIAGTGWLPAMLFAVQHDDGPAAVDSRAAVSDDAAADERGDDDVTA